MPDDFRIEQTDLRWIARLPRRPKRGVGTLLLVVLALPFLGFGVFPLLILFNSNWIEVSDRPVNMNALEWVGACLLFLLFAGGFCLLGGTLIVKALISQFGHSEIHLLPDRIRNVERWGPLFFRQTRPLSSLRRLNVVPAHTVGKPSADHEMALEAYFDDDMPLRLALLYRTDTLNRFAEALLAALPVYGGSKRVRFGPPVDPPRIPSASAKTLPPAPPPEWSRQALVYEQTPEATRITIPPMKAWLRVVVLIIAGSIGAAAVNTMFQAVAGHGDLEWPMIMVGGVMLLIVVGAFLAACLHVELAIDADGVTRTSRLMRYRRPRRFPADEIERADVETYSTGGGRGSAPRTAYRLVLIRRQRRKARLVNMRSQEETAWMRDVINDALQRHAPRSRTPAIPR